MERGERSGNSRGGSHSHNRGGGSHSHNRGGGRDRNFDRESDRNRNSMPPDDRNFKSRKNEEIGTPDMRKRNMHAPRASKRQYRGDDTRVAVIPRPELTPKNPKFGYPTKAVVNHFAWTLKSHTKISEYNVDFQPPVENRFLAFQLFQQIKDQLPPHVLDYRNLFTVGEVPPDCLNMSAESQKVTYRIFLKKTDFVGERHMQVYNLLMRRMLTALNLKQIGRNFYDPKKEKKFDHFSIRVWPGFSTSVVETDSGISVIADISHKHLRMDTVYDLFLRLRNQRNAQTEFERQIRGNVVITKYNNRNYRIDAVDWSKNPESTFLKHTGESISYRAYMKQQYNIDIRDIDQPLLVHRKTKKKQLRDLEEYRIYLIPELCCATGLTDQMRLDFRLMKELGTVTRVQPDPRGKQLSSFFQTMSTVPEVRSVLDEWQMTISPQLTPIDAWTFNAENIISGSSQVKADPKTASWDNLFKGNARVLNSARIQRWALIFPEKESRIAEDFCRVMQKASSGMGLAIDAPRKISLSHDYSQDYEKAIHNLAQDNPQLVCCLLTSHASKEKYDTIKNMCTTQIGVPSQVILTKSVANAQRAMSVITKIAMQMNCKLGGDLWSVDIPLDNLMVVGIDVCTDKRLKKSIVSFCSSINRNLTQYYSVAEVQEKTIGNITDFGKFLYNSIRQYYKHRNTMPDQIVIFRDGLSEGMLEGVVKNELEHIDAIFQRIGKERNDPFNPTRAFIVVSKRVQTRILEETGPSQFSNPLPGTSIDHGCTQKGWWEFYLASQSVFQGTVAPTRYHVIADDTRLTPEQIQLFTYKLCHLYANWSGTVRVPAPCQYARKLAFLISQSTHKVPAPELNDLLHYL